MSKILIDIGRVEVEKIVCNYSNAMFVRHYSKKRQVINNETYVYESIASGTNLDFSIYSDEIKNKFKIVSDDLIGNPITHSIFDRSYLRSIYFTKRTRQIRKWFLCYLDFLHRNQVSKYVLYATPHNIHTWIMSACCKVLDIPVYYLQESIIPWRYFGYVERYNKREIVNIRTPWERRDNAYLESYKNKLSSDSFKAPYIKQYGKNIDYLSEIKRNPFRVDMLINKFVCYQYYKKISNALSLKNIKYVFFPLQYSPERSTLPEGGEFYDQYNALVSLRLKLPKSVTIVVKEHPTTFEGSCHWGERSVSFYNLILELKPIVFAPMDIVPSKLIRNSMFTVCVNSSIAFESIVMRKPVVCLSKHKLFGIKSDYLIKLEDISDNKIFHEGKFNDLFDFDSVGNSTYFVHADECQLNLKNINWRHERDKAYKVLIKHVASE